MPSKIGGRSVDETATANDRAFNNAAIGAAKWGSIALGLGFLGQFMSPIYRSLTPQVKIWFQISAMTIGAVIGAESGVRNFEFEMLKERRRQKSEEIWHRYESALEKEKELEKRKEK